MLLVGAARYVTCVREAHTMKYHDMVRALY